MGLLDNLLGKGDNAAAGSAGQGGAWLQTLEGLAQQHGISGASALQAAEALVQQHGGLGGLVQAFQAGGLGHVVSSWVGNGQNLPVSADQVEQALGGERIAALARKFNIDPSQASALLAKVLPHAVDRMTPQGHV